MLAAGSRIGPYEIQALIGVGGMGEVYRAHDTRLRRDVALKLLPEDLAADADRLARFQREAELLAALNHPNIATLYGLEDAGSRRALVMELVEGDTLAERISHQRRNPSHSPAGPDKDARTRALPIEEALPIARQIAEALETAHERGVVHRDLKPANIKVTADGKVKVLDFGLAKLVETAGAGDTALSMSPTLSVPTTVPGIILGTAAYMSPEQARGKAIDRRTDVWAFGCVLFEMLSGRRPFDTGDTVSDAVAAVSKNEPDWSALPPDTPLIVRTLLRRCLQKDLQKRLPHIGLARLEIDEAGPTAASIPAGLVNAQRAGRRVAWTVAALASITAIVIGGIHFTETAPESPPPIRFSVSPPLQMRMPTNEGQWLSPDGRHLALRVTPFDSGGGADARLAIRTFDQPDAKVLPGTEGSLNAFWSPDSRFLAFFADGKLKRIDLMGGPAQIICDARLPATAGVTASGTWSGDGTIVFGVGGSGNGLFRVAASGGTPIPLTAPNTANNETRHRHPSFLPDGRHFLYLATTGPGGTFSENSVHVGSLDGEPPKVLMNADTQPIYAAGFLLLVRESMLLAQPFDAVQFETTGDPIVVAPDVAVNVAAGLASVSASSTGLLSYRTTSALEIASRLTWIDRGGKVLEAIGEEGDYSEPRLSPDGTRLSVSVLDPQTRSRDIWIHDLARNGLRTRFTFDPGEDFGSVWSPDGRNVVFSAGRPNPLHLYQKLFDAPGTEELLVEDPRNMYVNSWSADGRFLLYFTGTAGSQTGTDIWLLPVTGERKPRPLIQTRFNEKRGYFSPDGRWVVYQSDESGQNDIYVMPFPAASGKWRVSLNGGVQPRWRNDGKELFFFAGNAMMAAEVDGTTEEFKVRAVRELFAVRRRVEGYRGFGSDAYDVTDGQRFLVNVVNDQVSPQPVTVITNWTATLR